MMNAMPSTSRPKRPTRKAAKPAPIDVMLVDDHPLWRDTLRKVLERQRFAVVVAEASDGDEAVDVGTAGDPDVVLMDIQLPGRDGIEATRQLLAAKPGLRVLVLASSDNRAQVLAAVEAGACGYLLKTAGSDEVRDAVRRIHAGELVFPPSLASVVLDELRTHREDGGTTSSRHVFRREGDYWTVEFDGDTFRLKHTRGAGYLATLLREPGQEFHSLDLVSSNRRAAGVVGGQDAGPALDAEAKAAYRKRLRDLSGDLEEAERWGDQERASNARLEIDALEEQLKRAVGLGGRDRKAASASERARVNVTLAIKATLRKIDNYSPVLAAHLSTTVKTGTYCSYAPDPRAPVQWQVR